MVRIVDDSLGYLERIAVVELGRRAKLLTLHFSSVGTSRRTCQNTFCSEDIEGYPLRVAKVLDAHEVTSLEFTSTKGLWRDGQWGSRLGAVSTYLASPVGSLMKATFSAGATVAQSSYNCSIYGESISVVSSLAIHERWRRLRASASSLLVTPLGGDESSSPIHSSPFLVFEESKQVHANTGNASSSARRSIAGSSESDTAAAGTVAQYFPRETLSLQLVNSLVKMLPCKDKAGIAQMIDRGWFLSSPWRSVYVHATDTLLSPDADDDNSSDGEDDDVGERPATATNSNVNLKKRRLLRLDISVSAVLVPDLHAAHRQLVEDIYALRNRTTAHISYHTSHSDNSGEPTLSGHDSKGSSSGRSEQQSYQQREQQLRVSDDTKHAPFQHCSSASNSNSDATATAASTPSITITVSESSPASTCISSNSSSGYSEIQQHQQQPLSQCSTPLLLVHRTVRDSRATMFSVTTSIENPSSDYSCCSCCCNTIRVSMRDLLVPYYDILLHTYTYSMHASNSNDTNTTSRGRERGGGRHGGNVAELPSFVYMGVREADAMLRLRYTSITAAQAAASSNDSTSTYDNNNIYNKLLSAFTTRVSSYGTPSSLAPSSSSSSSSAAPSRHAFGTISWAIDVPPGHTLVARYQAVKRLLHRENYPADASRGLGVHPTFIELHWRYNGSEHASFTSTDPGLITMPIPDFSMPFNVITLVSTVVAFFLGSMVNTLVRRPPTTADRRSS